MQRVVMVTVNGGTGLMVEEEEALSSLQVFVDVLQGSSALPLFFLLHISLPGFLPPHVRFGIFFGLSSLFSFHC